MKNKKLTLSKKTVSNLNSLEMKEAQGGKPSGLTCYACSIIVCIITEEATCTCNTTT